MVDHFATGILNVGYFIGHEVFHETWGVGYFMGRAVFFVRKSD